MTKRFRISVVVLALICIVVPLAALAAEGDEPAKPQFTITGDLELFYELSEDVDGTGDADKFKSNQLYLDIKGKFDEGLGARLKLDAADIVSSDGKVVTEKVIEEANFSAKNIGGSPLTLVFGKDEMPFGLDYDKYLNDSVTHQFEIDKVWGVHGIVELEGAGSLAAAAYQHRHADEDDCSFAIRIDGRDS